MLLSLPLAWKCCHGAPRFFLDGRASHPATQKDTRQCLCPCPCKRLCRGLRRLDDLALFLAVTESTAGDAAAQLQRCRRSSFPLLSNILIFFVDSFGAKQVLSAKKWPQKIILDKLASKWAVRLVKINTQRVKDMFFNKIIIYSGNKLIIFSWGLSSLWALWHCWELKLLGNGIFTN